MQASVEAIREIGAGMESLTFYTNRRGKPRLVTFASATKDEIEPIVDGFAAQYEVPTDDVAAIAGLVRAFAQTGRLTFTEFHDLAWYMAQKGELEPVINILERGEPRRQLLY